MVEGRRQQRRQGLPAEISRRDSRLVVKVPVPRSWMGSVRLPLKLLVKLLTRVAVHRGSATCSP